jgi:membrane protein YqaA with SNARE-associated domain
METISHWIAHYGYAGIFFLLLFGIIGLPVPDEWLLTFAGYLVFKNNLLLLPTYIAAALGSMCGITVSYGLGRSLGLFVIHHYGRLFRISPEQLDKVHAWFDRFGTWTLLIGYFIPGVRHRSGDFKVASFTVFPVCLCGSHDLVRNIYRSRLLFWRAMVSRVEAGSQASGDFHLDCPGLHRDLPGLASSAEKK